MRFTRTVALFLTLTVPCAAYAQHSKKSKPPSRTTPAPQPATQRLLPPVGPPQMSLEKAFYYFVAIFGPPDDVVGRYGKFFDSGNYERFMADEFERNKYRERLQARISEGVKEVDFNDKFTLVTHATLGEYSFGSHSFPIVRLPEYRVCIDLPRESIGGRCRGTFLDLWGFRVKDAVNGNSFNWNLSMSEVDASAFIKSRSKGTGDVDRGIRVKITYSLVNKKGRLAFSSFIFSVEAYDDERLIKKLGAIPKINSITAEQLALATLEAQTATREVGRYAYLSGGGGSFMAPEAWGTITLTDVGIELSGEQPNGRPKKEMKSFYQVCDDVNYYDREAMNFWRANDGWVVLAKPVFVGRQTGTYSTLRFSTREERDRFFVDFTRAFQEWQKKYASFQFAAGKLNFIQN